MDSTSNPSFAELYRLDERKYANEPVAALVFSNRTLKRFRLADIITIADLLRRTPTEMMQIDGFGAGCLREIEQALFTLKTPSHVEKINLDNPGKTDRTEQPPTLDNPSEQTLGQQYGMDPDSYTDIEIISIPFSARTTNTLLRNGIKTIAMLLTKTQKELMSFRNIGKTTLIDIDQQLISLRCDTTIQKLCVSKVFTPSQCYAMANGDFSFVENVSLPPMTEVFLEQCMEAQRILGSELTFLCLDSPQQIAPIRDLLNDFVRSSENKEKLLEQLREIPSHRHDHQAVAYINAFTPQEEVRSMLRSMYPTPTSPLRMIVDYTAFDMQSLDLAKRFLAWCKFDLQFEINQLFSTLYASDRNRQVIQLRAQKKTLEQIGQKFGLTRERIRQIEFKVQRTFNLRQARIKIVSKINADQNNPAVVSTSDLITYCTDQLQELRYLLQNSKSSNYTYDKDLDIFVVGDDSLHERVFSFVENLPDILPAKDLPKYYREAEDEYEISQDLISRVIADSYQLTGNLYHRSRLSLARIYTEIIGEFYPNGIHAYDSDELLRFRQLILERYGDIKQPDNDRAISARIAGICILCDRGCYRLKKKQYIPKDLANRICSYIENSDMDIFMTNTLFSVFEKDLRKAGVDNKYYLQGILHELYGDRFTFTRDYISKDSSITSIYSSIVKFIREYKSPVNKDQILSHFPGLPDIAISLSVTDPEVLNYFGDYFHGDNLDISEEEKHYLERITRQVIADGQPHHASEIYEMVNLEKPEIFTRNYAMFPFSAYSVLEYLFRDKYQFSRPFIAQKGIEITHKAERLHDFVYSQDCVKVSEISTFVRDQRLYLQSILVFLDECNDQFLITDSDTLRRIDQTGINAAIAREIESLILEEVCGTKPIRDLMCWSRFPAIRVPWTEWLVYSVLKKWSKYLHVAPSNGQYRLAIPLVAPTGKMNAEPFADAYKTMSRTEVRTEQVSTAIIHDLDQIDDLLVDILSDDILGDNLWDSEI